jgi:peptide deformylase
MASNAPNLAALRARREAAFARILQWGDPVLRTPARPVAEFDAALAAQAADMEALMEDANGVGLAAPQLGLGRRLLVYRAELEGPVRALVNPVVQWSSEETEEALEGCLSIGRARVAVSVPRAIQVVVEAQAVDGSAVRIEAEHVHARVLQHEIDHLDGVLMLSRTHRDQRREAVRALRLGEAWAPPQPPGEGDDGDEPA